MGAALVAPIAAAMGGTGIITTALPAIAAVAGGMGDRAEAKAMEEQARINSYIGRTRAAQTDVSARESLNSELGTLRATLSANGQRPTVGTEAIFNELRNVRARDRRVEFGNRMQEASSYNMQANNYRSQGRWGMTSGIIKAAPSVFDVLKMKAKGY